MSFKAFVMRYTVENFVCFLCFVLGMTLLVLGGVVLTTTGHLPRTYEDRIKGRYGVAAVATGAIVLFAVTVMVYYQRKRNQQPPRLGSQQCDSLTTGGVLDHDAERAHQYNGLYINIPPPSGTFSGPESPPPSYENSIYAKPIVTPPPTYSAAIDNVSPPVWNAGGVGGGAIAPVHCYTHSPANPAHCPQTENSTSHSIHISEPSHNSTSHETSHNDSHHVSDSGCTSSSNGGGGDSGGGGGGCDSGGGCD